MVAVNGRKWSKDELRDALIASGRGVSETTLLIEKDDLYKSVVLNYSGGPREAHLVRIDGTTDVLSLIAQPRVAGSSP